jgi:hypothetical protein
MLAPISDIIPIAHTAPIETMSKEKKTALADLKKNNRMMVVDNAARIRNLINSLCTIFEIVDRT